jgi:cytochrome bd ubiquinol oxidase subunit I
MSLQGWSLPPSPAGMAALVAAVLPAGIEPSGDGSTGRDVPEYLGGFYVNGKVYFGLHIPYADSLLVGFKPSTKVTGLDSVAPADRPPALTLIHLSFDAMVGLAFWLLLAGLWALLVWRRRRGLPRQSWF